MNKRQRRIQRIVAVAQEFLAARTAADWLRATQDADPAYGHRHGWDPRAVMAFAENLEATYSIRMYAEFEAGLRDYWKSHLKKTTYPTMRQLVRYAIPNQMFSQDCVDNADDVRKYRNHLVHDIDDDPPEGMRVFSLGEAKRCLCEYFARLNPQWR